MEIDLVRYHLKYKVGNASDNSVYTKICKKFETKGYPRISLKSIKYKFDKLVGEPLKLRQLQEAAAFIATSDDEETTEARQPRQSVKKTYSSWDEDMEVSFLHLSMKIKRQHPAMPDNALFRRIVREMELEGYNNITTSIIFYHHKKLKQDKAKLKILTQKAEELAKQEEQDASHDNEEPAWTKSADAALVSLKEMFQNQKPYLKPIDIWFNVMRQLDESGHGSFTERNVKRRYLSLMHDKERIDELKVEAEEPGIGLRKDNSKRNYLHWTEEMKHALMTYRNTLSKREAAGELWEIVAKRMRADGYGNFSARNVKYKYFNLKKQKVREESAGMAQREFDDDEV